MLKLIRFANHGYKHNTWLELSELSKQVKVIALRKIQASKEIIIYYNYNAFKRGNYNYFYKTYKPFSKSRLKKTSYY